MPRLSVTDIRGEQGTVENPNSRECEDDYSQDESQTIRAQELRDKNDDRVRNRLFVSVSRCKNS